MAKLAGFGELAGRALDEGEESYFAPGTVSGRPVTQSIRQVSKTDNSFRPRCPGNDQLQMVSPRRRCRRCPVDKIPGGYVVRDANGQAIA
jgi:hypothetical protein